LYVCEIDENLQKRN